MRTFNGMVKLFSKKIKLVIDRTSYTYPSSSGFFHSISKVENDTQLNTSGFHGCREIAAGRICHSGAFCSGPTEPLVFAFQPSLEMDKYMLDSIKALNDLESKHNYEATRIFKVRHLKERYYLPGWPVRHKIKTISTKNIPVYLIVASSKWKATSVHLSVFFMLLRLGCFYKINYNTMPVRSKKLLPTNSAMLLSLRKYYLRTAKVKNIVGFLMDNEKPMRQLLYKRTPISSMSMYGINSLIIDMKKNQELILEKPQWFGSKRVVPSNVIAYNDKLLLARYVRDNINDYSSK